MLKIRLTKIGNKGSHLFRIVTIDERKKRQGKPVDILGFWQKDKNIVKIDKERVKFWTEKGAQITEAVQKLISK